MVEFFLQFHQLNQLIVDIDSTHFTTYGKQEGVAYNAHYRAHGYHPLYAFEGKTGYCFNAQLRPGNRYCSEEADSFITPVLERFNQLLFRMDSGFATPKLYDLIEKTGQYYLIKLKKNTVLSRLGDLSLPCPQDEDLTILRPTPPTQKLSIKQDLGRTSVVSASSLNEKKETCSTMLFLSLQI
ncbi:transposase-like protein, IS1380 ISSpn5 [Streptococcus pneumoniae]|nr:transposase-like protein, IS1380 ISSpn5 [Streptococcus pneumoniae]VRG63386.1 transposase-like protein, IS1380 ISSpn5 [Streptococcus pneumoniae]